MNKFVRGGLRPLYKNAVIYTKEYGYKDISWVYPQKIFERRFSRYFRDELIGGNLYG